MQPPPLMLKVQLDTDELSVTIVESKGYSPDVLEDIINRALSTLIAYQLHDRTEERR